ncbi:MAG TPA: aminoacyl-tRNA hydrolase [Anaeromyxobacteraceae bacterium]|nr:aminoacyl-tRNA hydrolase [Anaeromyxobacteraceae bacterium]
MKLVVGLGNPGEDYARTRHNLGYLVADRLAEELGTTFASERFAAALSEARLGPLRVLLMKPLTYMNHSGEAVGAALRFYKLGLEDLVVVHDDLELDPFRVQVKVGGGHGGHNGLKSLNAHLGSPDYPRVRMGVGRPPLRQDPADFVLARFPLAQGEEVRACVARAAEAARAVVELGAVKAMNQFNRRSGPGRCD